MKTNVEARVEAVLARLGREAIGVELAIKTAQILTQAGAGFRVIADEAGCVEVREDDDTCIPLGFWTITSHGSALHREVEAACQPGMGEPNA